MADKCPKCGSEDLLIGAFPLSCMSCGWTHNNKYPCSVCGKPAFCGAGVDNMVYRGCRDHPYTSAIMDQMRAQADAGKHK